MNFTNILSVPKKEHAVWIHLYKFIQMGKTNNRSKDSGSSLGEGASYWNRAEGVFWDAGTVLFFHMQSSYMEHSVCENSSSYNLGQCCPV